MSRAQELVTRLHLSGVRLALSPQGKLLVSPPGSLAPDVLDAMKQHRSEVLALLEAVTLRAKLTLGPQHIAPLIAEWVGTLNKPTGRSVDDLLQARWCLKVEAYVGEDGRLWWRLPQVVMQ